MTPCVACSTARSGGSDRGAPRRRVLLAEAFPAGGGPVLRCGAIDRRACLVQRPRRQSGGSQGSNVQHRRWTAAACADSAHTLAMPAHDLARRDCVTRGIPAGVSRRRRTRPSTRRTTTPAAMAARPAGRGRWWRARTGTASGTARRRPAAARGCGRAASSSETRRQDASSNSTNGATKMNGSEGRRRRSRCNQSHTAIPLRPRPCCCRSKSPITPAATLRHRAGNLARDHDCRIRRGRAARIATRCRSAGVRRDPRRDCRTAARIRPAASRLARQRACHRDQAQREHGRVAHRGLGRRRRPGPAPQHHRVAIPLECMDAQRLARARGNGWAPWPGGSSGCRHSSQGTVAYAASPR